VIVPRPKGLPTTGEIDASTATYCGRAAGWRFDRNLVASRNQSAAESARACALANPVLKIRHGMRTARP
jgi:hypothetical protein